MVWHVLRRTLPKARVSMVARFVCMHAQEHSLPFLARVFMITSFLALFIMYWGSSSLLSDIVGKI